MRHDRNAEQPGEPGDAQEWGDAADPADVRLEVVDGAGQQHVPELRFGVQALAGRHRDVDGGPQRRVGLDVFGRQRLLQPEDVERGQRLGRPAEVAYGILFLASDEASFVTGAELAIDGGYLAQ